jgi:hypothetical protein
MMGAIWVQWNSLAARSAQPYLDSNSPQIKATEPLAAIEVARFSQSR